MVPELQCSSNDIHTHALAFSLYEVFFCACCKYIQEHILTAEDVKTCRENAISRFPAGFFFLCYFHLMSDASARPH